MLTLYLFLIFSDQLTSWGWKCEQGEESWSSLAQSECLHSAVSDSGNDYIGPTNVYEIVGTSLLKMENPTMVTETIYNNRNFSEN